MSTTTNTPTSRFPKAPPSTAAMPSTFKSVIFNSSKNVKEMLSSSSVKAAESRVMVTSLMLSSRSVTQSKMPQTMWSFTSDTVRLLTVPSTLHHSSARAGQEGAELANVLTNATHYGCLVCPLHRRSQLSCTVQIPATFQSTQGDNLVP